MIGLLILYHKHALKGVNGKEKSMDTGKSGFDRTMVAACGLMAALGALAVMAIAFLIFGVDVTRTDPRDTVTLFTLIAGVFWGILMCRNS